MNNPYLPHQAKIQDIKQETTGDRVIKTFKLVLEEPPYRESFAYKPGQCGMLGISGVGESMISITSSPTQKDAIAFSIMKMGKVTSAIHGKEVGDTLTLAAPFDSGLNFLQVLGLSGGMPTLVSVNKDRFEDALLALGVPRSEVDALRKD